MHRPSLTSVILISVLVALVATPLIVRPGSTAVDPESQRLIIITPHNQQIRQEFAWGFDAWYRKRFGTSVVVDFRRPGGTS